MVLLKERVDKAAAGGEDWRGRVGWRVLSSFNRFVADVRAARWGGEA